MKRTLFFIATLMAAPLGAVDFTQYHNPSQIDTILTGFQTDHPTIAKVVNVGTSLEGRTIKALKISDNVASNEPSEGDVVIMATHHAREWLATETSLFIADQLLSKYGVDAELTADINNLQIWIIPLVNPDGFAFTQTAGNRYWRKTRRANGDGTFGVDPNRNWGYQWGLDSGSSPDSEDDDYRGPNAWSEPEVVAMRNFQQGLSNLKAVITYHSFSELFLRPWSYTTTDPPGEPTLAAQAVRNIGRISGVHNHTYAQTIWYTSSGEATDWSWHDKRAAAFTPEVRPVYGSGQLSGFSPPATEIIPNGQENWAAAAAIIHDAGAREVWIRDYTGDTGAEPSAVWSNATGWSHPIWTSPDIWTDPATLDQGATVTLNVHVNNNTGQSRTNVRIDAYFADPSISLEFPNPNATLIGTKTVTVPPGGTTVTMPWTTPVGTNSAGERHWCVGVVVMHDRDLPLTTQAERSSNIAFHNFHTTQTVVAANLIVTATNFLETDAELATVIDRTTIPPGWTVILAEQPKPLARAATALTSIERKGKLLNATGRLLRPGETIYVPVHVEPPKNARSGDTADVSIHAALLPLVPGKREPLGNGFTYKLVVP